MAYLEYTPTRPLFHYTSIEGFKGILSSGSFWLSDLQQSNDPRELRLPKEQVFSAIRNFDRRQLPLTVRDFTIATTWSLIHALDSQRIFSFCLTPNRDSLTEWKEYADNGKGVCFSIRPRALRDMYLRVQKVRYVEENDTELFTNIVEEQYEKLRFVSTDGPEFEERIEIITPLLSAIYSIKHISWSGEKEIRLTFASANSGDENSPVAVLPDGTSIDWKEPKIRETSTGTVDYHALPFGRYFDGNFDKSGSIAEIILGPNCTMAHAEIEKFVSGCNYENVKILTSNCAFNPR